MKIALVENFGSDFFGARLRYALFLKEKGHEVVAVVPDDGFVNKIREYGIETIAINIDVRNRNIKTMFLFAKQLSSVFRKQNFDVIHFYRMQPNLIGTPIAFFVTKRTKLINHITGLGVAFTKKSVKYKLISFIIKTAYNINSVIFNAKLIFQNIEDKIEIGNREQFFVVKGSAVNEDKFSAFLEVDNELKKELRDNYGLNDGKTMIFVSRLLKQKGLSFLIESVKRYNSTHGENKINLLIAGWLDDKSPDSYSEKEINEFSKVERVVFLGRRTDIEKLIAISDLAVLPTYYREGTPRFLLEAMSMGKPILTTNMPGCNHLVENRRNGLLVEPQNLTELINAIEELAVQDLKLMGEYSKVIYEREFSENVVYNKLLNIYFS